MNSPESFGPISLREGNPEGHPTGGREPVELSRAASPCLSALGFDIGGTKIAAGLVTLPEGRIASKRIIPTAPQRGGEHVLNEVLRLAQELASEAGTLRLNIACIGLGLCELVGLEGQVLSSNCVRWKDQPVHDRLARLAPVTIEADVRAAARAEAMFGAGRSFSVFLYLTVGTGIASSLVIEGQPFTGARGATGTIASSPSSVVCERCGHADRRTLEEIASGPALVARFNHLSPRGARTGQDVLAAAAAGDSAAVEVVNSAGEALGSALGLLVNVLDPEAVIIGGGLGLSEGRYWESLLASTRRHIWSEVHRDLPILRAGAGLDAGWIGAAAAAWKRLSTLGH